MRYLYLHMLTNSPAAFGFGCLDSESDRVRVEAGQPIGFIGINNGDFRSPHIHLHISATDRNCNNRFPDCGRIRINDDGSTTIVHCTVDRHVGDWLEELLPKLLR